MTRRSLLIDCDPGQDDAVNLLLAMASPDQFDLLGITTVAGNVPLELTARNACLVCDIADRQDVAVFAGCSKPLQRRLVTAENVHGLSGLDGIEIVTPRHRIASQHAVDFICETLRAATDNSITLVLTGPLTNIATVIERDRSLLNKVSEIVLMGGARREGGNYTPSAEFNMLVDPHAASVVVNCGRHVVVIGLDATSQAGATPARRARLRAIDNRPAKAAARMLDCHSRLDYIKFGDAGAPLHDPCTIAFLLEPTLFESKRCNLEVETQSELTMGHTAVDFWGVTNRAENVTWIYAVDGDGLYDLLIDRLSRYHHR